jgi:uncharacterized protein (DUF1499 family)
MRSPAEPGGEGRWHTRRSRWATGALLLALGAGLLGLAAGPGYRFGLWPLGTAFTLMRWSVYGGSAAILLALVGAIRTRPGGRRRGFRRSLAGLAIGLVVVGLPLGFLSTARGVPPIHDITTDPDDPPAFEALLARRAGAPNPPGYAGEEVAARQRAAYPEIQPLRTDLPPERAFEAALVAAERMGWEIVGAAPSEGRIEATDTTFWFGFKDDVVIRVRPENVGSRIDLRSKSRVGISDLGTNAARVQRYLTELSGRIAGAGS